MEPTDAANVPGLTVPTREDKPPRKICGNSWN